MASGGGESMAVSLRKASPGGSVAYVLDHEGKIIETSSEKETPNSSECELKGENVKKLLESVDGLLKAAGMEEDTLRKVTVTTASQQIGIALDSKRMYVVESLVQSETTRQPEKGSDASKAGKK
eukprot:CAMPEP_0185254302 /NCGR_PEP_ID=MMETSP1359-20130426/3041_1 /TAXON_ID=552665 /ORGANISM="Bigelowiella longifila, Strain CCMP242" /LENGTH=123 /DNA_ID=CAMNT_0027837169 /DNA_START=13 /DNA_END=384 /DNA_ORIENTATION=-